MFCPGGGYPDMDKDAVLYGGTDPGRFVPTYMIFCESFAKPKDRYRSPYLDPALCSKFDRRDVYIITQNALADQTYMSYIRDHYDFSRPNPNNPATIEKFLPWQRGVFRWGWKHLHRDAMYPREPIFIPNPDESNRAFPTVYCRCPGQTRAKHRRHYHRKRRVSVNGVQAVMAINGILARQIFDRNKEKHAFYVEESYVIQWMYPYLSPYGVIMKIQQRPLADAAGERATLDEHSPPGYRVLEPADGRVRTRGRNFARDSDGQKAFSKLRTAIAGIYEFRRLFEPAEYAYKQAIHLYPASPEACFRLANLYMQVGRVDDAINVLMKLQLQDPLNTQIGATIQQFRNFKTQAVRMPAPAQPAPPRADRPAAGRTA